MRCVFIVAALASAAHADSLAVGVQAGKCANCASGDQLGTLGAALEVDHALGNHVVAEVELAQDWLKIASDECEYQFSGNRTLFGAGVRWQPHRDAGVFAGLAIDASHVMLRDRCAGSPTTSQWRPALVPAVGYDLTLGTRTAVRFEAEGVLQQLVTYATFTHQTVELVVGARYVVVL